MKLPGTQTLFLCAPMAKPERKDIPVARKRLTQRFPFLLPLRRWQRKFCFYLKMRLDKNRYAADFDEPLPFEAYRCATPMVNPNSGFAIAYQYNKVHNLRLAAAVLDRLVIRPGETFSFCLATRHADRKTPYKDGLNLVDGKIVGSYGGGLCHMSNLLYWLFLHSPLTMVERHAHAVESFPPAEDDRPAGVDATVSEGWLDLKVRNDTNAVWQLRITFDGDVMTGALRTDKPAAFAYTVENGFVRYERRDGRVYQIASVRRRCTALADGQTTEETLYENVCEIGYPLPEADTGEERMTKE